ncbi:MAG: hypothetical protein WAU82_11845 [Candidatus Binatus sp.]|uniref:hypothetical protein n=1 Tax=Candidatus Binatus sp. TaxID=2811406 RepID=UPI003BAE26A1
MVSLEPAFAPEFAAEGFIGLPGLIELPVLFALAAEFIALTPGLLGTSDPAGPGTEPATGPELPALAALPPPMLPPLVPVAPDPPADPDAPAPAPPAPPPPPPPAP